MRMATPFFDTMVNKENVGNYQQPMMGNDYYKPMMEPGMLGNHQQQQMGYQMVPPELQHFIAGPTRMERNPLSAPMSTASNVERRPATTYNPDDKPTDLKDPAAQYQRYVQILGQHYYDTQANTRTHQKA